MESVLAVIPARSGSKGLPGKNLMAVGEYSLVGHAITAARASKTVSKVCVSTDSETIRAEAVRLGVDVPWLRSAELSGDESSTAETVIDALTRQSGDDGEFDIVVVMEPTAPLRRKDDVDRCVSMLRDQSLNLDAVITMTPTNFHPSALHRSEKTRQRVIPYLKEFDRIFSRRQDGDVALLPVGNCFAIKSEALLRSRSLYPEKLGALILDRIQSFEVDDLSDLDVIRAIYPGFISVAEG